MSVLLLVAWGVLTLAAAGYSLTCGGNAPVIDEWEFVAVLVGKEPWVPWLWAQHNEHRLPLAKLIYLAQFRLTHDFRSGMLIVVGLQSALALGLMRFAAHLRGRTDWADLFFPITLLHVGQWENLLLGYQICFALFTVLASGIIVVALRVVPETAFRCGVAAGALALLAALCGGPGLVLLPPVAAWLGYLALVEWRRCAKGKAVGLLVMIAVMLGYLTFYLTEYRPPGDHPRPSAGSLVVFEVALQVASMAFGFGVAGFWRPVVLAELVLSAATLVLLVRQARDPSERPSTIGVMAISIGLMGIALAIGVGRGGFGPDAGLWSRYGSLSWPLLAIAYLSWVKSARGATPAGAAKWIPAVMCVAAALAFPPNLGVGLAVGAHSAARYSEIDADVRYRMPDDMLIAKHFPKSRDEGQEARAAWGIPMLRAAGIGIFATGAARDGQSMWWIFHLAIIAAVVGFGARWVLHLGRAVQVERARELFRLQHERFEEQLLQTASATGSPRGLRWVSCAITGDAVIARDAAGGGIVALVPVEVRFEPVAGSDMEEVPAAREPRPATAVFTYTRGHWETAGRVVFNHTPEQTIAAFAPQLTAIRHGEH